MSEHENDTPSPVQPAAPAGQAPLDLTYYGSGARRWSSSGEGAYPLLRGNTTLTQSFSLALQQPGLADRSYMTLPNTSLHIGNNGRINRNYNDANHGIGLELQVTPNTSLIAGGYKNSYGRETVYAGVAHTPLQTMIGGVQLAAGGVAGIATGYADYARNISIGNVTPVLGLHFSAAVAGVGLNVTVLPPAPGPSGATAFAFAFKREL